MAQVRLFVDHPLGAGQTVPLEREQAHYLFGVMRLKAGDSVLVFNGVAGEWRAGIVEAGKRGGSLECRERTAPQRDPPDLWLLFAPLKKARTDFVVEKAVEMGAARICPVQTAHTNAERIRRDRLQAHAVEAAEQCGGTFVPEVADLARLDRVLADWPADREILFCDETLAGGAHDLPKGLGGKPWAIVIGPEGGFSEAERDRLRERGHAIALGPRILRAETAAVAALTLWQARLGDWG
ncbi:16S rRNA (uracil(1498)-N(3))-methyltransferase [Roseisalinus antarcticus]|uniref:Ribosomal RNA small subunit methyltransferase E n=1 Tax=Roseisalinus antarcticus TaxID=254357 RepID=A0A1Y5RN58_9RHOB|nr:16S rRNA (uracil(1498)-N(3))-methyltransferase [Roseisalinus antarcticus]SLN21440.1 Ribosomal RNA small subunit methyltransferase E [Roseisalinus antarcticus]